MKEYIIVGDFENKKECLIYACGVSWSHAKRVLELEETNLRQEGYKNVHIKTVEEDSSWWNDNCD